MSPLKNKNETIVASYTAAAVHLLSFVLIQKKVTKKKSRKKRYTTLFFLSARFSCSATVPSAVKP
jgi:hypothetical protein